MCRTAAFVWTLALLSVNHGWDIPAKVSYEDHPCKRDCLSNTAPMVCQYDFVVEHYQTLSRACYDCPRNITDCLRPHCIPADGGLRAIKVVNRMMPGPAIHVCKGDTVVVDVYNEQHDMEGTAIHWHGILQHGSPHMDGVPMITQCPITAHSVFQYRFMAADTGTHFWHAHAGMQRADGIFGAIVVRETTPTPVMDLYDLDLPEHTLIVHDWLDQYTSSKFSLHHHGMADNEPSSILINGRGSAFPHTPSHGHHMMGKDEVAMTEDDTDTHEKHQMSQMHNQHGGHDKHGGQGITNDKTRHEGHHGHKMHNQHGGHHSSAGHGHHKSQTGHMEGVGDTDVHKDHDAEDQNNKDLTEDKNKQEDDNIKHDHQNDHNETDQTEHNSQKHHMGHHNTKEGHRGNKHHMGHHNRKEGRHGSKHHETTHHGARHHDRDHKSMHSHNTDRMHADTEDGSDKSQINNHEHSVNPDSEEKHGDKLTRGGADTMKSTAGHVQHKGIDGYSVPELDEDSDVDVDMLHDMSDVSGAVRRRKRHSDHEHVVEETNDNDEMKTDQEGNHVHDTHAHTGTHDVPVKESQYTPRSVFRVEASRRYRFRFISNGILNCPLKVSIEKHSLTIIASDGFDTDPIEVDSFTIFGGERYDVVVTANQPAGNYWMYVVGLGDCEVRQTFETAILRYNSAMETTPMTIPTYETGIQPMRDANPFSFTPGAIPVAEMTSQASRDLIPTITSKDVKTFYLAMDFNNVENHRYLDADHYTLATMRRMHTGSHSNHLYALQMNHITFGQPTSPMLTQYSDIPEARFCNDTSAPRNCRSEFCECIHRIKVAMGDVVELVLVSEAVNGMGNHPMHLHGYGFYVLGMEKLSGSTTRRKVERLDAQGKLKRNLVNPVRKDTVMVPDGGYTVIRFLADNPGMWFFHCHVEFHLSLGLSLVLQVGEPSQMPRPPGDFPRCGNWRYSVEPAISAYTSQYNNARGSTINHLHMISICIFLLSLFFVCV